MSPRDILEWSVLEFVVVMLIVMVAALLQVMLAIVRGQVKPSRAFDGKNGMFEWKRFWTQAIKALLCYAMVKDIADGQPNLELLFMCAALVGGHEFASIWLDMKGRRQPWTDEQREAAKAKPAT